MIIKLTHTEVKKFIRSALNIDTLFTLEIAPDESPELVALRRAVSEFPPLVPGNKIPCIKLFRELCPKKLDSNGIFAPSVGLADAKWAVENSDFALRNLEQTGRVKIAH